MRVAIQSLRTCDTNALEELARISDIVLFSCDSLSSFLLNENDTSGERSKLKREISIVKIECMACGVLLTLKGEDSLTFIESLSKACMPLLTGPKPHDLWVDYNIAAYLWSMYVTSEEKSLEIFSKKDLSEKASDLWLELLRLVYENIVDVPEIKDDSLFVYICIAYGKTLLDNYSKGTIDAQSNKGNQKTTVLPKDFSQLLKQTEEVLRSALTSKRAETVSLVNLVGVWDRLQTAKGANASPLDSENIFLELISQLDLQSVTNYKSGAHDSIIESTMQVLSSYDNLPTVFHLELTVKVAKQLTETGNFYIAHGLFKKVDLSLFLFEKIDIMEQVSFSNASGSVKPKFQSHTACITS
jgi:hypothetical protein